MKNHKKRDDIKVNHVSAPNNIVSSSNNFAGNAGEAPFCIYAGKRHAVGSVIKNEDGSKIVCTEDGSWQNM